MAVNHDTQELGSMNNTDSKIQIITHSETIPKWAVTDTVLNQAEQELNSRGSIDPEGQIDPQSDITPAWTVPKATLEISGKEDIFQLQKEDADFADMINYKLNQKLPRDDQEARKLLVVEDMYAILDGKLFRETQSRNPKIAKEKGIIMSLCLPKCKRQEILSEIHNPRMIHNHFIDTDQLTQNLKETFYWPGMYQNIHDLCDKCELCQAKLVANAKRQGNVSVPMRSV